jgi:hypothetical protein
MMFLPLVVLINLSLGSKPNDVLLSRVPDPALVSTPIEIYGNCTERIARLTARRAVLKNEHSLPIWLSLEARSIQASIARERRECLAMLVRAIASVKSRLAVADHDITEQNNIIDTARSGLVELGKEYVKNIDKLINGQTHTSRALVDRVQNSVFRWISLSSTDCTADTVRYMERSCDFLEDLNALTDISLRPSRELGARVPVGTVHSLLQPMVTRIDGEWPRIESAQIRALDARRSNLTRQLTAAHEFIAALST